MFKEGFHLKMKSGTQKNCCKIYVYSSFIILWSSTVIGLTSEVQRMEGALLQYSACPENCTCYQMNLVISVNCTSRQLANVPYNLPRDTTYLYLNRNRISTLTKYSFSNCTTLQILDLSQNVIKIIENGVFEDIGKSLKQLYLNKNKISINRLPESIFEPLYQLEILDIHYNKVDFNKYNRAFCRLRNLKMLTLDGLPNASFDHGFSQLNILKIYGGLDIVKNSTFDGLDGSSLTHLIIRSRDNLYDIESMSFSKLHNLQILDLAYNRRLGFQNLSKSWIGLASTNVSTLILTNTNSKQDAWWQKDFFHGLERTRVTRLNLDKNNIVNIDSGFRFHLSNLEYLDMAYNRLSNIESFILDISCLNRLSYFDASYQMRRYVNSPEFFENQHITENEHRFGEQLSEFVRNKYPELHKIPTNGEQSNVVTIWDRCKAAKLTPCTPAFSDRGPWCILSPPKIENINLTEGINIQINDLPIVYVIGSSKLIKFQYARNALQRLTGPIVFTNPNKNSTVTADFSQNGLQCVAEDVFTFSIIRGLKIGSLNLSHNGLHDQLENDISGRTFKIYKDLTELDISFNALKILPYHIFEGLQNVKILKVNSNSLRLIEFQFSHMRNLSLLDLSNNLIATFNSSTMLALDNANRNSNLSVNLKGNPLQCSCDTLDFLKWMTTTKVRIIVDMESYDCILKGEVAQFDKLEDILIELDFLCSSKVFLAVSAGLIALTIVILALSVCAYRHKWDIRFCMIQFSIKRKQTDEELEEVDGVYEYDAFVAYHTDDRHWVINELMRNLEGISTNSEGEPFTIIHLCIHDRDFLPGNPIQENIIIAIEKSRKTILVISRKFATSSWCEFELQMAAMQSIDKGREIIVAVLLEPVEVCRLSSSLARIVRRNTYIEWTDDTNNREEFWIRLRKSVSCPISSTLAGDCEYGRRVNGASYRI